MNSDKKITMVFVPKAERMRDAKLEYSERYPDAEIYVAVILGRARGVRNKAGRPNRVILEDVDFFCENEARAKKLYPWFSSNVFYTCEKGFELKHTSTRMQGLSMNMVGRRMEA
jgi:hypothetical protein